VPPIDIQNNYQPNSGFSLDSKLMFKGDKVNWTLVKDFLKKEGRVGLKEMMKLLDMALDVFGTS
jgi:hypothetical protein